MSAFVAADFIEQLPLAFRKGDSKVTIKEVEADNLRLLQANYQAIALGDFETFEEMLAEDVDFEILGPLTVPFLGSWQGRKQVAEAVRNHFAMLEEQCPELESVVAQGDTVVVSGRERGRYKETGHDYDVQWVQFHTFFEGKLIHMRQLVTHTRS
ncbi:nuclear transport factor 2 family protein [Singulisphaera sp. Ch08]|uniref:Nuclear transport factor 2 family protein n=1 Tax=Singulisphaera sp. Ch08 TaxID=3120278 RepID=A0AAU7CBB9_9BACT